MPANLIKSIYTDGACSGNPGPGGWGTVIYFTDGSVHEMGGGEPETTNNRMEMQAAIAALEFLITAAQSNAIAKEAVTLYTDSEYVKNGVTKWIAGWKKKGWKTAAGKPVLNQDLWETLDQLNTQTKKAIAALEWQYVKGHAGIEGNERCDTIARAYSLGKVPAIKQKQLKGSAGSETEIRQSMTSQLGSEPTSKLSQQLELAPVEPAARSKKLTTAPNDVVDVIDTPDVVDLAEPWDGLMNNVASPSSRIQSLRELRDVLTLANEIATNGYFISSAELAALIDVPPSALETQGDRWIWRNWRVSLARKEGDQMLWQLDRAEK